jgi:hypothetical protein
MGSLLDAGLAGAEPAILRITGLERVAGQALCLILARQESSHLRPAHRAGALGHSPALICHFDTAVRDLAFRTTFYTVAFKLHEKTSLYG